MRFLAPENFDTPNNKQGHETGHERRIEEEKCLKAFQLRCVLSYSSVSFFFRDWRIIMVKCPLRKRYTVAAGNWMMVCGESSLQLASFFLIQPQLIRCESLRKYCGRKKKKVSRHKAAQSENARSKKRQRQSIINFLLSWFFHPILPIDFKTCRHS